jgi:hypothetical protein
MREKKGVVGATFSRPLAAECRPYVIHAIALFSGSYKKTKPGFKPGFVWVGLAALPQRRLTCCR